MRVFSVLKPAARSFINLALKERGWTEADIERASDSFRTHREDSFSISDRYPIYAVADGVTLSQFLVEKKPYPHPSPAGEVARIFCETFVREAEARYDTYSEKDIEGCFRIGNEAVKKYNKEQGRSEDTVDYWDTDYYAATAAFAIVKGAVVYWGSICDSYVAHYSKEGSLCMRSPSPKDKVEASAPPFEGKSDDFKAKAVFRWKNRRNALNEESERIGYGVITGEENAVQYLNTGVIKASKGDVVFIVTDGFEDYLSSSEFVSLFLEWSETLEERFEKYCEKKIGENPKTFGHERTLIAISI